MLHTFVFLLFCLSIPFGRLRARPSHEYRPKAAFLHSFASGTNPFSAYLEKPVRNETVRGRRLVVEHYKTVEEIQTCHILYIGQSEARRLQRVVRKVKGKPMLTVSDVPGAADEGVAVGFVTERYRVKLHVNLEALESASFNRQLLAYGSSREF